MSLISNEDDLSFVALPAHLRHRIDSAFDSIVSSGPQLWQSQSEIPAGGFIVGGSEPGPSQHEPGGFIVEDPPSNSSTAHIPLSEIPRALSLLDLFPDDDIMGVFKNAATGWGAQDTQNDRISRKDWRAVCAALLEGEHADGSNGENRVAHEDVEMGADSGSDSDQYQMEEMSSDTEEASSDEYEEPSTAGSAKKTRKAPPRTAGTKSSGAESSRQLTEPQKTQCRQEFSRFFPHVPDHELDHQRIMIRDIARVAELLKENLKTEEVGAPPSTLALLTHVPKDTRNARGILHITGQIHESHRFRAYDDSHKVGLETKEDMARYRQVHIQFLIRLSA